MTETPVTCLFCTDDRPTRDLHNKPKTSDGFMKIFRQAYLSDIMLYFCAVHRLHKQIVNFIILKNEFVYENSFPKLISGRDSNPYVPSLLLQATTALKPGRSEKILKMKVLFNSCMFSNVVSFLLLFYVKNNFEYILITVFIFLINYTYIIYPSLNQENVFNDAGNINFRLNIQPFFFHPQPWALDTVS